MKVYDVSLETLLGKRKGELKAEIDNERLYGFLSLLGHTEPIEGTINAAGECFFTGKFITLINTVDFTAHGTLSADSLQLIIKSDESIYRMTGLLHGVKECDNR